MAYAAASMHRSGRGNGSQEEIGGTVEADVLRHSDEMSRSAGSPPVHELDDAERNPDPARPHNEAARKRREYKDQLAARLARRRAAHHVRLPSPTRDELYHRARRLGVAGRSGMSKEELQQAIQKAEVDRLEHRTLDELHDCARALDISGRSHMSRDELVRAIREVKYHPRETASANA